MLEELENLLADAGADSAALRERIERSWEKRSFDAFYDRPLLLIAALRFDALRSGREHPLWRALAARVPEPETLTRASLLEALRPASVWDSLELRYVQTNETSRAVAWLWPAALAGCDRGERPLVLVEIGCSAGLNLIADRLPAIWTDQSGAPLPVVSSADMRARIGIDLRPLDVRDDEAVNWMRACIWAGENQRIDRFDAAVRAFRENPPELVSGNALDAPSVLERVASKMPDRGLVLAFQTIVRDYFDAATKSAYLGAMRNFIASMRPGRALWTELELEHLDTDRERPTAVTAHVCDKSGKLVDLALGRTNYHPSDVIVDREAVARFTACTSLG